DRAALDRGGAGDVDQVGLAGGVDLDPVDGVDRLDVIAVDGERADRVARRNYAAGADGEVADAARAADRRVGLHGDRAGQRAVHDQAAAVDDGRPAERVGAGEDERAAIGLGDGVVAGEHGA